MTLIVNARVSGKSIPAGIERTFVRQFADKKPQNDDELIEILKQGCKYKGISREYCDNQFIQHLVDYAETHTPDLLDSLVHATSTKRQVDSKTKDEPEEPEDQDETDEQDEAVLQEDLDNSMDQDSQITAEDEPASVEADESVSVEVGGSVESPGQSEELEDGSVSETPDEPIKQHGE